VCLRHRTAAARGRPPSARASGGRETARCLGFLVVARRSSGHALAWRAPTLPAIAEGPVSACGDVSEPMRGRLRRVSPRLERGCSPLPGLRVSRATLPGIHPAAVTDRARRPSPPRLSARVAPRARPTPRR
jgi:hypothetical protein